LSKIVHPDIPRQFWGSWPSTTGTTHQGREREFSSEESHPLPTVYGHVTAGVLPPGPHGLSFVRLVCRWSQIEPRWEDQSRDAIVRRTVERPEARSRGRPLVGWATRYASTAKAQANHRMLTVYRKFYRQTMLDLYISQILLQFYRNVNDLQWRQILLRA
jgi:hypothetical protein